MDSSVTLSAFCAAVCAGVALRVGLRRTASPVAYAALLLLGALLLWNAGLGVAHCDLAPQWRLAALRVAVLGVFAAPGTWVLLALRHRDLWRSASAAAPALALAPAFVYYAVTLNRNSDTLAAWRIPEEPHPISIVFVLVASACWFAGCIPFARTAWSAFARGERRTALAIALALVLPLVGASLLPGGSELGAAAMPASLTLSVLVLGATCLRYELLDPPPLGHREVIDHLRHGVLMAGFTGEILDHNPAAERTLGFSPRGRAMEAVLAAVPRLEAETGRVFEVWSRAIRAEDGSLLGHVGTLRDRTEERRYADAAMRAQKLETVGTLAAGIAHEVNNPLAFVRANVQELARMAQHVERAARAGDCKLAEDLGELGELADVALEGLERIQRSVADVRRLAAAPAEILEWVSLDNVALDALRLVEIRAGRSIEIVRQLAPGLPQFRGSRQLLLQAVFSVLLNASQAAEGSAAPRIEVETGADAESVWLRVRDSGPGLPDALRERIFEPFFTAGTLHQGAGLGLSVARDIAQEHGGSLVAEPSESGACFCLRLARSEEA